MRLKHRDSSSSKGTNTELVRAWPRPSPTAWPKCHTITLCLTHRCRHHISRCNRLLHTYSMDFQRSSCSIHSRQSMQPQQCLQVMLAPQQLMQQQQAIQPHHSIQSQQPTQQQQQPILTHQPIQQHQHILYHILVCSKSFLVRPPSPHPPPLKKSPDEILKAQIL